MVVSDPNKENKENVIEIAKESEKNKNSNFVQSVSAASEMEHGNDNMVEAETAEEPSLNEKYDHALPFPDKECSFTSKMSQAKATEGEFMDMRGSGDFQLKITMVPPDDCMVTHIPPGDYQVVTWDLDTTGKRLIDEICHIAAYYPDKMFTQYVMPHRNPSPGARRSFGIRVVNIGRYRMLKNIRNGKILKTKSEISALNDFIRFLEEAKDQKEGVILVCHETRKVNVPLLLEALQRFNLTESFFKIVRGFGNSYPLSEKSCEDVKYHTLRNLCKFFLEPRQELDHAAGRAKALYEVLQSMLHGSVHYDDIKDHCVTPDTEKKELQALKGILKKQGTLRPIFENEMQKSRRERQRASILRRLVAEGGLDYEMLSESYKKDGMEAVSRCLKERISAVDGIDELIQLMEDHFEPQPEVESKSETTSAEGKQKAETKSTEGKQKAETKSTEDKPKAETAVRPRRAPRAKTAAKAVESPKTSPKTTTKADPEPQVESASEKEVTTDQEVSTEETSDIRKE